MPGSSQLQNRRLPPCHCIKQPVSAHGARIVFGCPRPWKRHRGFYLDLCRTRGGGGAPSGRAMSHRIAALKFHRRVYNGAHFMSGTKISLKKISPAVRKKLERAASKV